MRCPKPGPAVVARAPFSDDFRRGLSPLAARTTYLSAMDTPRSSGRTVAIDVVSDVVCPWCYLGKRRLEKALTLVPGIDAVVRWHPFQLDPTIPPERNGPQGIPPAEVRRSPDASRRLTSASPRWAGSEGIDYEFDKIARSAEHDRRAPRDPLGRGRRARGRRWSSGSSAPISAKASISATAQCSTRLAGEAGMEPRRDRCGASATDRGRRGGQGRDRRGLPHRRHRRALLHHRPALRRDGRARRPTTIAEAIRQAVAESARSRLTPVAHAAAFSPSSARRASRIISAAVPLRRLPTSSQSRMTTTFWSGRTLGERAFARRSSASGRPGWRSGCRGRR